MKSKILLILLFLYVAISFWGCSESSGPTTPPTPQTFIMWNSDCSEGATCIYKLHSNGDVISSIPAPSIMPTGLAYDGNDLWCSEYFYNQIHKINPADGNELSSFAAPGYEPTGLTWDGTYLWCAARPSLMQSGKIFKIDASNGSVLETITPPPGDQQGLAWHNGYLWIASMYDKRIYKFNPSTGIYSYIPSPGNKPLGLCWHGSYLWNVDSEEHKIYKIDPDDGTIKESFATPSGYPWGLVSQE